MDWNEGGGGRGEGEGEGEGEGVEDAWPSLAEALESGGKISNIVCAYF